MSEENVESQESAVTDQSAEAAPVDATVETHPTELRKRHLRKTRVGQVVSNKMNKTIVVEVVRRVPHQEFGKIVKRTKKFYAHDAANTCAIGDLVRIEETKPLSRLKRWQLVEVLKH